MIAWCQHIKTFFLFFLRTGGSDLQRNDCEQLCVFSSRIRLDSLPIPMPPLLPDQDRTLKTNNCEYTACSRRLGQLRFPMPNLPAAQAAVLTPNNCRYSLRCRRLEPDPIPITCT